MPVPLQPHAESGIPSHYRAMSLDVYLLGETRKVPCICEQCDHEHEREDTEELFWSNITHNLNQMADAAGIYGVLWRPDEVGITHAAQLVEPLRAGLAKLEANPAYFRQFDASNGWGTYEQFVPWVRQYLRACEDYPDATVRASR